MRPLAQRKYAPARRRAREARPLRRCGAWLWVRWTARGRFPEEIAEQFTDRVFWAVLPGRVPVVCPAFPFFLEGFSSAFLDAEEFREIAAEMHHGPVKLGPHRAVAHVSGNAEVHADIGDGTADRTAAHLGFEFLQRGDGEMHGVVGIDARGAGGLDLGPGGRAEFHVQRCDVVGFGGAGGLRRLDIPALRGAGEQIPFQHHRAENAALHMRENAADVVGAEAVGKARKMPVFGAIGEGAVEVFAVAQQGSDDV